MANLSASPAKLRDGSWGARIKGAAKLGDIVTITTSAGKTWEARVTSIVWSGEGATICATQSTQPAPKSRDLSYRPVRGCADCRRLGRMCRRCQFDEYDM